MMDRSPRVAALLARFPGPVTIERTALRKALDTALAIVLAIGAARYVWVTQTIAATVGGLIVLYFAWWIARHETGWTLDAQGLTTAKGKFAPWKSSRNFRTWVVKGTTAMIFFDRRDASETWSTKINRMIFRRDDTASVDAGGLGNQELDDLLNTWRSWAAGHE